MVESSEVDSRERYVVLPQRRRPARDGSRSGWDVSVIDREARRIATGSGPTVEDAERRAWERLERPC